MKTKKTNRHDFLEDLFKKYPDVPKEVVVKSDFIRNGYCFTKAAIDFDPRHKDYQLFSQDKSKVEEMEDPLAPLKLPDAMYMRGGPYNVRRIRTRPIIDMKSPYLVDVVEDKLVIMDKDTRHPICDVLPFPKDPDYCDLKFDDGTPYRDVVSPWGDCIPLRVCHYWATKDQCKYCDLNANAIKKLELGQVKDIRPKKPEQVAKAAKALVSDKTIEDSERPCFIHLNGGTITGKVQGRNDVSFWLTYVEAVLEAVGSRLPIILQTSPWKKEVEKEIRSLGNVTRVSNYEVWDRDLFEIICPGKAKHIGREEWHRRILDQVDVYGEGNVCPGYVAGMTMVKPWGFKTVEEAVKSDTEGMEFFMSRGAVVRPLHWVVEDLSDLAGQEPPPVDYFIQIDRNWFEIWTKYKLPPVVGLMQVGPGINWFHQNAAFDMGLVA